MTTIYRLPGQPIDRYPERGITHPAWCYSTKAFRWHHSNALSRDVFIECSPWTHWSPDAPTPPEESPGDPESFGAYERSKAITEEMNAHPQPSAVEPWMEAAARAVILDWWGQTGAMLAPGKSFFPESALLKRIACIIAQHAPAADDTQRLDWKTGIPEVALGDMERFWCAIKTGNGKPHHRHLCYANKHVMPLSDHSGDAPDCCEDIVGDEENYAWTGWFEESCDQCETQWQFTDEVVAWMRLPKFDAAMRGEEKKS